MAIVNEEDIVSEKSAFIDKQCDTLKTNRESKMAKQNVYDNEGFFENFKDTRSKKINFNDCIETPILLSLLPEVRGKTVLDIGCGMGQHAKQYSNMGAKSVIGIDISERMLEYAKEHFNGENITYLRLALEDISALDDRFDLVTSSLVFDYAENLDELMRNVYRLMNSGAYFVFSMSHPMATAWDGTCDRYTRTASGERLYANVPNYMVEGKRSVKWVVKDYELYHRTFSTIVNAIVGAGLKIERCEESRVSDEMRTQYPEQFGGTLHRPDFVFFRCRKVKI